MVLIVPGHFTWPTALTSCRHDITSMKAESEFRI
jgi:hypothetical protein